MTRITEEDELFYNTTYDLHKDSEHFLEYRNRDSVPAFAFWDGVSYWRSYTRPEGRGHKSLTVICKACLGDKNSEVRGLVKNFKFKSNLYSLLYGSFPCGCSKQRGKTLQQNHGVDDFIGETKQQGSSVITIMECLGGKGNQRRYIQECTKCSLDEELWPYGSIVTTKSNFEGKPWPNCGCNPSRVLWKEFQAKVICERIALAKNLKFLGWSNSKYTGTNSTRIILDCPYHGISTNTRIDKFKMREGGCAPCANEFGVYGWYKDKEFHTDFIYLIKVTNTNEYFYKIGRTFNINRRLKQHRNNKNYTFDLVAYKEGTHKQIFELETYLLKTSYTIKHSPEFVWAGGYNECRTPEILNHPDVISTFSLNKKETPYDKY